MSNETENDKTVLGKLETIKHIHRVRHFLSMMIEELDKRAREHDLSKLESPEKEIFGEYTPELAKVDYGTPEYQALLEKVKPAIEHHYSKNRHHPEFFDNGINGMDLCDLLEMICDWRAATERHKNGNILQSIEFNAKRYGISDQLTEILYNTAKNYFI